MNEKNQIILRRTLVNTSLAVQHNLTGIGNLSSLDVDWETVLLTLSAFGDYVDRYYPNGSLETKDLITYSLRDFDQTLAVIVSRYDFDQNSTDLDLASQAISMNMAFCKKINLNPVGAASQLMLLDQNSGYWNTLAHQSDCQAAMLPALNKTSNEACIRKLGEIVGFEEVLATYAKKASVAKAISLSKKYEVDMTQTKGQNNLALIALNKLARVEKHKFANSLRWMEGWVRSWKKPYFHESDDREILAALFKTGSESLISEVLNKCPRLLGKISLNDIAIGLENTLTHLSFINAITSLPIQSLSHDTQAHQNGHACCINAFENSLANISRNNLQKVLDSFVNDFMPWACSLKSASQFDNHFKYNGKKATITASLIRMTNSNVLSLSQTGKILTDLLRAGFSLTESNGSDKSIKERLSAQRGKWKEFSEEILAVAEGQLLNDEAKVANEKKAKKRI